MTPPLVCWWPTPEPVAYLVGVRGVGKISVTLSRPPVGVLGVPTRGQVAVLVGVPVPECHQIDAWPAGVLAARLPQAVTRPPDHGLSFQPMLWPVPADRALVKHHPTNRLNFQAIQRRRWCPCPVENRQYTHAMAAPTPANLAPTPATAAH